MKQDVKDDRKSAPASRMTIRKKVFLVLLIFMIVTLVLFWLFQVILFGVIYRTVRINELKATANYIIGESESLSFYDTVSRAAATNDLAADIFSIDGNLDYPKNSQLDHNSILSAMEPTELASFVTKTEETWKGTVLYGVIYGDVEEEYTFFEPVSSAYRLPEDASVLLVTRFERAGEGYYLMLDGSAQLAGTVLKTNTSFLLLVDILLFLLAILLSFFLSKFIADPIAAINKEAKKLSHGSYEGVAGGTRELDELNETLKNAAKELAKVENTRKELIANLSHDLRTPLTLIKGYTEMMRDLPGEATPENFQEVIDETERLTSLVNDMFDISRLESGHMEPRISRYCLTSSIAATVTRYGDFAAPKGYHILLEPVEEDVFVNADETMITQALSNLLNNAMTYTGEDKTVTVRQKVWKDTGKVRVEVSDTGCGIEADKLPLIWERYYKVDAAHKRAAVGNGLGLSIVRGILEMHGGSYGVRSTPDKGSTFWFELPMA